MRLSELQRGMLFQASRGYRIYMGPKGCLQGGFRSGCWSTAMSLWLRGLLRADRWTLSQRHYGAPSVHLAISDAGRRALGGGDV